jgi:hypothetical protein
MTQTMYTHVNKCINNFFKKKVIHTDGLALQWIFKNKNLYVKYKKRMYNVSLIVPSCIMNIA